MSQATSTPRPTPPPAADAAATEEGPPYLWALLAGLGVFALYAITLAPTTAFWDTSEYIATAHILGIPHPPGNPLFVILARSWELLLGFTGLSSAVRVNLFSAVMGAGAAAFWYLVTYRILCFFTESRVVRGVGAGAAVLVSATAFTVWNHSNVNEKVYTVSLFTIALLSWVAFLWRDHVERHRDLLAADRAVTRAERRSWHDDNALVFVIYVLALSVGNHLMAFLIAPALAVFLYMVKPRVFLNWRIYAWGVVFAVIGLSVHLFLPIRAALDPIINEADPVCQSLGGAVVSVLTLGGAGCEELSAALAREQYAKPPITERLAPFSAQLLNYFQYFDWQWSRSLMGSVGYLAPARLPFTLLFLLLGGYGAWEHWKRDRPSFAYIAILFLTLSLGLIVYLNFEYGWAQVQAWGMDIELAEVRERDYFFLVSFSVWGLWAGIGITALWLRALDGFRQRGRTRGALLKSSPVLALALIPLVLNWPYASRADDYAARDWAHNLLMSVEPYGVLFTNGDNDTFPLWYLQEVEGIRQDVTVIVWSYLNTPWYAQQIRQLTTPCEVPGAAAEAPTRIVCQRVFEEDEAPEFYRGLGDYPTRTVLPLTDEEIRQSTAVGYIQFPNAVSFEARGVRTQFEAGSFLAAADQFILTMIKEAWGDRPIYFAATTNVHRKLGLDPFTVRQGVAYKLVTPTQTEAYLPMPQDTPYSPIFGAYLDVDRTQQLLWETFVYRDLIDRDHWPDAPTAGIPTYYGYAHLALAQGQDLLGNEELVERNLQRFEAWMDLAQR